MTKNLQLKNVKMCWLNTHKPDNFNKYGVTICLEKNSPYLAEIKAIIKELPASAYGMPKFNDGDTYKKDYLKGYWYFSAHNVKPIKCVDSKVKAISQEDMGRFIEVIGNVNISISEYEAGKNKGVTIYCNGVQVIKGIEYSGGFEEVEDGFVSGTENAVEKTAEQIEQTEPFFMAADGFSPVGESGNPIINDLPF